MITRFLDNLKKGGDGHTRPMPFPFHNVELNRLVKMCRPGFKPSELIEKAMRAGYYCAPDLPARIFNTSSFMCVALSKLHDELGYPDVEDEAADRAIFLLLRAVHPPMQYAGLQSALTATFNEQAGWLAPQTVAYRFQLYCWFAFDLRRRGL